MAEITHWTKDRLRRERARITAEIAALEARLDDLPFNAYDCLWCEAAGKADDRADCRCADDCGHSDCLRRTDG